MVVISEVPLVSTRIFPITNSGQITLIIRTTILVIEVILAPEPSIMARAVVVEPFLSYVTVLANLSKVFLGI